MTKNKHVLIAIVGVCWLGVLACLTANQSVRDWRYGVSSDNAPPYDLSHDPQVGSALPRQIADALRRSRGTKRVLVVALGPCDSCAAHSFKESVLPRGADTSIALVYTAALPRIHQKPSARNAVVVADPSETLCGNKGLNAVFYPRVYAYDARLRLVAIQKPQESHESFINQHQS